MQKEDTKFLPSTVFEGMVSIRALLQAQKEGLHNRKISKILYNYERKSKIAKEIKYLEKQGELLGFAVEPLAADEFENITLGSSHGGLIAYATERAIPSLAAQDIRPNGFYVMIQGIEDPYNFGYALRSLYALGIDGIVLPPRNWMSAAGVVCRASAGASELFPMFTADAEVAADLFLSQQYTIVCADADTDHALEETPLPYPIFLIIGGEKRGISAALMQKATTVVRISYGRDFPAALSAASATTILAYEIAKQNRK